ncbi:unnamed protein product [Polarella glacialis]|uniref:Uncharacterized protein n=1 Tax=Polarella glacialis TaxID=89957 RepID=A0A813FMN2_POLGL|nr:unnamed protein product [Polarella glacialis]
MRRPSSVPARAFANRISKNNNSNNNNDISKSSISKSSSRSSSRSFHASSGVRCTRQVTTASLPASAEAAPQQGGREEGRDCQQQQKEQKQQQQEQQQQQQQQQQRQQQEQQLPWLHHKLGPSAEALWAAAMAQTSTNRALDGYNCNNNNTWLQPFSFSSTSNSLTMVRPSHHSRGWSALQCSSEGMPETPATCSEERSVLESDTLSEFFEMPEASSLEERTATLVPETFERTMLPEMLRNALQEATPDVAWTDAQELEEWTPVGDLALHRAALAGDESLAKVREPANTTSHQEISKLEPTTVVCSCPIVWFLVSILFAVCCWLAVIS